MRNVVHRPCTICEQGHFKCNAHSTTRTCSKECSHINQKNSAMFAKFKKGWYKVHDLRPNRNASVVRDKSKIRFAFEARQDKNSK